MTRQNPWFAGYASWAVLSLFWATFMAAGQAYVEATSFWGGFAFWLVVTLLMAPVLDALRWLGRWLLRWRLMRKLWDGLIAKDPHKTRRELYTYDMDPPPPPPVTWLGWPIMLIVVGGFVWLVWTYVAEQVW